MILCYELSDQESLTLHQVKAHDVRSLAASKAFQSRVSLEQILSACHWKSHNTFTKFQKDVAWCDSELYHVGPVVAPHSLNTIVFKLQVILLMMEVSEKSKSSYYSLS